MNNFKNRKEIESKMDSLQKKVLEVLRIEPNVDKFLDNTTLFDEWEEVIPDPEYGIFVIAVLNNIKTKVVIDTIVDSILKIDSTDSRNISKLKNEIEQHPFC